MGGIISKNAHRKYALQVNNDTSSESLGPPAELPVFVVNTKISKTTAKLMKIKSAANLNKIVPGGELEEGSPAKKSKIRVSRSANSLHQLAKSSQKPVIMCSQAYPWLIKKTSHFENSSLNDYDFGRVLGAGLMGTVCIAKSKVDDKFLVFKSIPKKYIVKHDSHRHVVNEKNVMNTVVSGFCARLFGTFQDKNYIYFAMEYVPGGELFRLLAKRKQLGTDEAKFYISEIFLAIEHIQAMGCCYRDLKPENVLIDEEGHCKLVDFGFAVEVNKQTGKMTTMCGTPAYLSPEQLNGKATNGYTAIVDWWSLGVLLYELLTGVTPFCKDHDYANHYGMYLKIITRSISFPFLFDAQSKRLVSALCHRDLDKRLVIPDLIRMHPYFNVPWDFVTNRQLVPPFVPKLQKPGDTHYYSRKEGAVKPEVGVGYAFRNELFDF